MDGCMYVIYLSKIGQTTAKQTQNALVVKTPIRRKKNCQMSLIVSYTVCFK